MVMNELKLTMRVWVSVVLKGILTIELYSSRSTSMTAGEPRGKPVREPVRGYFSVVNLD